jgi:FlaA1/EpsC-like NDP-sugar epimerase
MQKAVLEWSRATKRSVVVLLDIGMALVAMWCAFTLRLDALHWPEGVQWLVYAMAPVLAVPVFVRFGLYRAILRYTGLAALVATGQAVALYGALLLGILLTMQWQGVQNIPRSVGVLQPLIFLLMVGFSRAMARFWLAGLAGKNKRAVRRLLIYGAGSAGAQTAAALASTRQYSLLGFIDDDPSKTGRSINDVRVFDRKEVAGLVSRQGITDILLALPSVTRERRNQIIASLYKLPVHIRTLPGLADLTSGRVTVQDFRELDIEDLLGRPPVPPNPQLLSRNLHGKVVLVTGAGGSIGSELCRQIVREHPRQLVLFDHSEFALYDIHRELLASCANRVPAIELTPLLGNVGHYARVADVFQRFRPATVYHAAAYKHVPMVESNPAEGILNNVFGTLQVVRAALEAKVEHFVLVSTDKAVRPTNVMGASKRVAELILQAVAASDSVDFGAPGGQALLVPNATRFAMVRFGNVLGSSGSVVPAFRRQIAAGGPITVTHPEVTRYFMTTSEAAQLVLQAGAMATGGDVFLLDMGEPVRIMDLAHRMIALSGLTVRNDEHPDGDIEIAITGLRPGEKLYEELLISNHPERTDHARIMKAREEFIPWAELKAELEKMRAAALGNDAQGIAQSLHRLVAGYTHDPSLVLQ